MFSLERPGDRLVGGLTSSSHKELSSTTGVCEEGGQDDESLETKLVKLNSDRGQLENNIEKKLCNHLHADSSLF